MVAQAVRSALEQDYLNLEIIVSDDGSPDQTYAVAQAVVADYHGPHRVEVRQAHKNQGLIAHLNLLFDMARGDLVVLAAGDDVSRFDRVSRLVAAYRAAGEGTMLLASSVRHIGLAGELLNVEPPIDVEQELTAHWMAARQAGVLGATIGFTRDLIDFFGPLPASLTAEDSVLPFRAALLGRIVVVNEKLVDYRVHPDNLSALHQSPDRSEIRRRSEQRALSAAATAAAKLDDIARLRNARSERRQECDDLAREVRRWLFDCLLEAHVFGGTVTRGLGIAMMSPLLGVNPPRTARWLAQLIAPRWRHRNGMRLARLNVALLKRGRGK